MLMQVSAEGLNALLQELQAKLAEQATLKQERQEKLAALQQRLAEEASVLEASNAQVSSRCSVACISCKCRVKQVLCNAIGSAPLRLWQSYNDAFPWQQICMAVC